MKITPLINVLKVNLADYHYDWIPVDRAFFFLYLDILKNNQDIISTFDFFKVEVEGLENIYGAIEGLDCLFVNNQWVGKINHSFSLFDEPQQPYFKLDYLTILKKTYNFI